MPATGNFWKRFSDLIAGPARQVGTIASNNGNGFYTVTLPSGAGLQVQGLTAYTPGQWVFIRDGKIDGLASSLTNVTIEI